MTHSNELPSLESPDDRDSGTASEWDVEPEHLPDLAVSRQSTEGELPLTLPDLSVAFGDPRASEHAELPSLKSKLSVAELINDSVPEAPTRPVDSLREHEERERAVDDYSNALRLLQQGGESVQPELWRRLYDHSLSGPAKVANDLSIMALHGSLGRNERTEVENYFGRFGLSAASENLLTDVLSRVVIDSGEVDKYDPGAVWSFLANPSILESLPEAEQQQVSLLLRSFGLGDAINKGLDVDQEVARLLVDFRQM